jgi:hypothetical protein
MRGEHTELGMARDKGNASGDVSRGRVGVGEGGNIIAPS